MAKQTAIVVIVSLRVKSKAVFFSRVLIAGHLDENVKLKVNRIMGQAYRVQVTYRTMQVQSQKEAYGVTVYPALEGEDYDGQTGTLVFEADSQELQYIDINLSPIRASSNPYPKQFYVDLKNPTNGARCSFLQIQMDKIQ